jgi:hypothetical protein
MTRVFFSLGEFYFVTACGKGKKISSPRRQDRPWGPKTLLFNGYLGLFRESKVTGCESKESPSPSAERQLSTLLWYVMSCGLV